MVRLRRREAFRLGRDGWGLGVSLGLLAFVAMGNWQWGERRRVSRAVLVRVADAGRLRPSRVREHADERPM